MYGNLPQNIKKRQAALREKADRLNGGDLRQAIRNAMNPAYASRGPCPSFATQEDMERGYPIKGWYGFPQELESGALKNVRPSATPDFWGLRIEAIGSYGMEREDGFDGHDSSTETSLYRASGYYMDHFGFNTAIPVVLRLPSKRGFIMGYIESDTGSVNIEKGVYDTMRQAFAAAHAYAERDAETSQEFHLKDLAEQETEYLLQQNDGLRAEALALIKEIKNSCESLTGKEAIKLALVNRIKTIRATLQENRDKILSIESNPYQLTY